jgi:tetratricopeptide (TPR) repeat protein
MKDQIVSITNKVIKSVRKHDQRAQCLIKLAPYSGNTEKIFKMLFDAKSLEYRIDIKVQAADMLLKTGRFDDLNSIMKKDEPESQSISSVNRNPFSTIYGRGLEKWKTDCFPKWIVALLAQKSFDEAEEVLKMFIEQAGNHAETWNVLIDNATELIVAHHSNGKPEKAEGIIKHLLKMSPHLATVYVYLSIKLADAGYFENLDLLLGKLESESEKMVGYLIQAYIEAKKGDSNNVELLLDMVKLADPTYLNSYEDRENAVILYYKIAEALDSKEIADQAYELMKDFFNHVSEMPGTSSISVFEKGISSDLFICSRLMKFNQLNDFRFIEPKSRRRDSLYEYNHYMYEVYCEIGDMEQARVAFDQAYYHAFAMRADGQLHDMLHEMIDETKDPLKAMMFYLSADTILPFISLREPLYRNLISNLLKIKTPTEVAELVSISQGQPVKNIGYLKLAAAEIKNGNFDIAFAYITKTDRIGYTIIHLIDELISTIQTPKQFDQFRQFVKKCFQHTAWIKNI